MDKKKFDEIMDQWAAHEMEAVPEIKPRPEVYRKLEEKRKKPRFTLFTWPVRLAAAGIAAVLIILVIVMQPPKEMGSLVGLRKGTVAEPAAEEEKGDRFQAPGESDQEERKEETGEAKKTEVTDKAGEGKQEEKAEKTLKEEVTIVAQTAVKDKETFTRPEESSAKPREEKEPEEGKKDVANEVKRSRIAVAAPAAPALKKQVVEEGFQFQVQPKGSQSIQSLDAASIQDEVISLSSEDNYRLVIELPEERYVYVFQAGVDATVLRLFPNADYNPAQNPVQAGKTVFIPLQPNWFYVEKDSGEIQIFVVTSAGPLEDWDEIYAEYSRSSAGREKKKLAAGLLDKMEQIELKPEAQISVKVFRFLIQ